MSRSFESRLGVSFAKPEIRVSRRYYFPLSLFTCGSGSKASVRKGAPHIRKSPGSTTVATTNSRTRFSLRAVEGVYLPFDHAHPCSPKGRRAGNSCAVVFHLRFDNSKPFHWALRQLPPAPFPIGTFHCRELTLLGLATGHTASHIRVSRH
jgi:hypothetical protein